MRPLSSKTCYTWLIQEPFVIDRNPGGINDDPGYVLETWQTSLPDIMFTEKEEPPDYYLVVSKSTYLFANGFYPHID